MEQELTLIEWMSTWNYTTTPENWTVFAVVALVLFIVGICK